MFLLQPSFQIFLLKIGKPVIFISIQANDCGFCFSYIIQKQFFHLPQD